jgi:hypothetical protein
VVSPMLGIAGHEADIINVHVLAPAAVRLT